MRRDLAVPGNVGCEKRCLTMMTKSCVIVGKTTGPTSWQPYSASLDRLLHRLCAYVHPAAMSVWFYVISGNRQASILYFCEVQHLGKACCLVPPPPLALRLLPRACQVQVTSNDDSSAD